MENKVNYYAIIPADVRYDNELTMGAKMMYGEITALSQASGFCFASNQYFAELYDKSKSTISRWITELTKRGYAKVELEYFEGTKEIKTRRIYHKGINKFGNEHTVQPKTSTPYTQKRAYGIRKNEQDNTTSSNTTRNNNTLSKDNEAPKKVIDPMASIRNKAKPKTKVNIGKEAYRMINEFTKDLELIESLQQYFRIRITKGLKAEQWKIILDDLSKYSTTVSDMVVNTKSATAGGYMQIIPNWEKTTSPSKRNSFDNTASNTEGKALANMTQQEREQYTKDDTEF